LPRPSNEFGGNPLKSRTRGRTMAESRSRNSYIRSPRKVTMQPMGMPLRILKFAIDFLARVITGFCPVICSSSAAAVSSSFTFALASPNPIFTVIFFTCGTAIVLVRLKRFCSAGIPSFLNFSCKRVIICRPYPRSAIPLRTQKRLVLERRVATPAASHSRPIRQFRVTNPCRLSASRADQHHVRHMHWPFLLQNAALDILRRVRTRVLLHDVRVLDSHRPIPLIHRQYFSGFAL